jgi:hypothetical protein
MKAPKQALRLIEAATAAGFEVETSDHDDGHFSYRYSDGSERRFNDVPRIEVRGLYGRVAFLAGWMTNPVSKRATMGGVKPVIIRMRTDNEYANQAEATINKMLGMGYVYWEDLNLAWLMNALEKYTADEFEGMVKTW